MHVFEILPIIYYPVYLVIALYVIGYGFTTITLPQQLKSYRFIMTPWFSLTAITFILTILSLAGLSLNTSIWIILPIFLILTGVLVTKETITFYPINYKYIVLFGFVLVCIAMQLMPLLRRDRMLTTISLGNNDVIVYANTPDYLEKHSIFEGYKYLPTEFKPTEKGVANLLHDGFRWGTPIMASFLQVISGLKGYQMSYMYLVVLYSLLIPLAYLLFTLLYKESWVGLIVLGTAFLFNVNMLYMLYHVFAGQIVFWGFFLLLLIYFVTYFSDIRKSKRLAYFDIIIAITLTTLYMSYHEGILFVIAPAILYAIITLFQGTFIYYLLIWSRIGLIVLFTGAPAVINATIFDFFQASLIDAPIGWERFRPLSPFADVFEMAGMHSLHTSPPLFWLYSIASSIVTAVIFILGYVRSRMKTFLIFYLALFILMLYWSSVLHNNFFVYNRVATYMLPLMLIIFAIGIDYLFSLKKILGLGLVILFVGLNTFYGITLLKKFMNNHLSVDRSLLSLQELDNETTITEPIYLDQVMLPQMYYWRMIWMEYFLYPNKNIISLSNYEKNNKIQDGSLLLVQDSHFAYPPPKIVLQPIVWDNGYFKIGRLCTSDTCLVKKKVNLSEVIMGQSEYEDTMLLSGWGANEGDHRWSNAKKATVRFTVPAGGAQRLEFEARSLQEPQTVAVLIDGNSADNVEMGKEWKVYAIPLPGNLAEGMHMVTFAFARAYKPSEVLGNGDTRELYVDFRRISLK